MDITLKSGNKILNVHCYGECGTTDYALFAEDENGTQYTIVFNYDDEWKAYTEEHPEEVINGNAWTWLICNKQPAYIYIDNAYHEDFYIIDVKNTDILW